MAPTVRPMTDDEAGAYVAIALEGYIEQRIASGERPDVARRRAAEETEALFPGGSPAEGHLLYRVLDDDGREVGNLWIGPHQSGPPDAFWVWDVEIDEGHRGRGLGRAAMLLAEQEARAHGATELGLNVFGHNTVARNLYESIGYQARAVTMAKRL